MSMKFDKLDSYFDKGINDNECMLSFDIVEYPGYTFSSNDTYFDTHEMKNKSHVYNKDPSASYPRPEALDQCFWASS